MRKILLLSSFLAMFATGSSAQWKPAGDKIKTKWASQVDPANVLPEYPRPIMERKDWKNLNGLWSYAIIDKGGRISATFDGEILVPFAVESSLSGVGKRIDENKELVYQRSFSIPSGWKGRRVLLHFGAVDWKADVWVNDVKVGSHTGGFTPFSFDITAALSAKGDNRLMVKVWDPTDKGPQPRGKQVGNPHGIWYTPVSGIWQTVWMEPVAEKHIANLRITPDIDRRLLTVKAELSTNTPSDMVEVTVYDGNRPVASGKSINAEAVEVSMPDDAKLWSPDAPFLYTLKVTLKSGGKVADEVDSYAAMRKYSTRRDADGIVRLELNNEPLFQFGPLDQGWWPDGLYTAPTDEALLYDIRKTKDFGFNMIRKHIKVEPARWYTHCDRLGIIVWQDMPSGDRNPEWQNRKYFDGTELKRTAESEACYRKEWKEIMDCLYSYPCIGTWVPFNEAWGQFKTAEIAEWTKQYDPTRLVNPASGGNHYACGDMLDLHNYPHPEMYLYDAGRATVLGEYGGIGLVLKDHLWEPNHNCAYVGLDAGHRCWYLRTRINGEEKKEVFALPADFRWGVYHHLRIERNGGCIKVWLDEIPAPEKHIFTEIIPAEEEGIPGVFDEKRDALFEGAVYTIGFDDMEWQLAEEAEMLKGDFLNDYEFSFQLSGFSEQDVAGCYPVYVDKDNYVKARFNGTTRMLEVIAVKKGKTAWREDFSLECLQTVYPDVKYTDFIEKSYCFAAPAWVDAIYLNRHEADDKSRFVEDMFSKFTVDYLSNGEWHPIDVQGAEVDPRHPAYNRLSFSPVKAERIRFINKDAEDLKRHIYKIGIHEILKASYNFRAVRRGGKLYLFVDGKEMAAMDIRYPASRIGFCAESGAPTYKGVLYYHIGQPFRQVQP